MEPDKTPEVALKSPGRITSAIRVLRGQAIVPNAIRAEWVAWQIEFTNLLDKVSQAAARAYERDRVKLKEAQKRIAVLEAGAVVQDAVPSMGGGGSWHPAKRELNRLALIKRGLTVPNFITNGEPNVPGDQGE